MEGKAIIFSAPSGSGKTTIVHHLLETNPNLQFSVSATTRKPRGVEIDGKDYYFLSLEEYNRREYVESEEVYEGVFYGTLKSEIDRIWNNEKSVVFDVDVKGGINLKRYFGDDALSVFVQAPSLDILKDRLLQRNTESSHDLDKRIAKAESEMAFANQFDYILVNDVLGEALEKAEQLVSEFLQS